MEIKDLQKYVPNLQLVIQNTCKTSVTNFEELKDADLSDKKLLCWGTYSKEIKKVGPVSFYRDAVSYTHLTLPTTERV